MSDGLQLPLVSLNHISFVCRSVASSVKFYVDVLGFVLIKRPSSFKFEGAWLFNYGVGIHLLECGGDPDGVPRKKGAINPKDNHISFQCSDMGLLKGKLEALGVEYATAVVEEGGVQVDQIFFHDPDGYMVEICNCNNLPVLPLPAACPLRRGNLGCNNPSPEEEGLPRYGKENSRCGNKVDAQMEILMKSIVDISF